MAQGLPEALKQDFTKVRNGIEQWARLVAWSWTDHLVCKDKEREEEEKLKEFFIQVLQEQAQYKDAVNIYGDERMKINALKASLNIKKLFMGKNQDIEDSEVTNLNLTLPKVYEILIGEKRESVCGEESMKEFHIEVLTDRFAGSVELIDKPQEFITEVKKHIQEESDYQYIEGVKYIGYMAYPPRPAFSSVTITEEKLKEWMTTKSNSYLPPSAYIPLSMT